MTTTIEPDVSTPAEPPPRRRPEPPSGRGGRRVPTVALGVIAGAIALEVLVQHWGLLVHDTRFDLLLEPGRFLSDIWRLWDPTADMGRIQNQAVGYLFPMGPFMLVGHLLHVPPWIVERGWIALLLIVAMWGMARLLDELEIGSVPSRVVAALGYALAPYFIARVGNTSAFVQGAAFLPWILIPLVRGSRGGSTRRAAGLSALAVLCVGGVNAAVVAAVLVVPVMWLLTRESGPRRRSLTLWWGLGVFLATAWWALPLVLYQARYGIDFLPFTERASTTTAFTSPFEAVRGVADWLSYVNVRGVLVMAGSIEVSSALVLVGSGLVAALGLFGLASPGVRERRFLVLTMLAGVAIVGMGYGGDLGNPVADQAVQLLDGPGAAFRSVYKFAPVVLVPLSIGLAIGVDRLMRFAVDRTGLSWARGLILGGCAVLLVLGAWPLVGGDLLNHRPFAEVPSWWSQARSYVSDAPGRTLLVPGLPTSNSTWGYTAEEPLEWGTSAPWATRSVAPLGSAGATRVLDTVEAAIERGGDPALDEYLARSGFSTVLVRNDGDWRSSGAPAPDAVAAALVASGLVKAASFGPVVAPVDELNIAPPELRAIDIYEVPAASSLSPVTVWPTADAAVVSGDAGSPFWLSRAGLADRALVLAQDLAADDPLPPQWIVTDGNRRAFTAFGLNRDNQSYVLSADDPAPGGGSLSAGFLPTDDVADQTVAERAGIASIHASSYGSWSAVVPEVGPPMAVDSDPQTSWAAATGLDSHDQWIQVDLLEPISVPDLQVQLLEDGPWRPRVQALEVSTNNGSVTTEVRPDESVQTIGVPEGATSWIRIGFAEVDDDGASTGPGIRELGIPGVRIEQRLVVPNQLADEFASEDRLPPIFLFDRSRVGNGQFLRSDAESQLHRSFALPREATMEPVVKLVAVPGRVALDLLGSSFPFSVRASSTLADLPAFGARSLVDGDARSIWVAGSTPDTEAALSEAGTAADAVGDAGSVISPGTSPSTGPDSNPAIGMEWIGDRTLDSIRVARVGRYAAPLSIRLVTNTGEVREAEIADDGIARFAPVTASSVTITFPRVARYRVVDSDGRLTDRPIALAALEFPGAPDLTMGPVLSIRIVTPCGEAGTISIDDTVYPLGVVTSLVEVAAMRPVTATVCGPGTVSLDAGAHHLDTTAGSSPFAVSSVVLQAPAAETEPAPQARRSTAVDSWGSDHRTVTVGPGAESYLVVAENVNAGWRATLDGETLRPVTLAGWQQGFVVPAGAGGEVVLDYTPTAGYRLSLVAGGFLVLVLVAMIVVRVRSADAPAPVGPGHGARLGVAAAVVVAAVVIGGPLALLLVPLVLLHRWRPWSTAVVSLVFFGAAAVVAGATQTEQRQTAFGTFGWLTTTLSVVAVLAVAATELLPLRTSRAQPGSASAPRPASDGQDGHP